MNLKEFNKENSAAAQTGERTITFNIGAGLISFSKNSSETFKLSAGLEIVLVQDEDRPEDWYLAKKAGGFALRQDSKAHKRLALSFNNAKTVHAIAESLGIQAKSFRCYIGTEPTIIDKIKYYPIITKSARS